MERTRREKHRDERDYDQTYLRRNAHGAILHRDYSAHFFRWSFARRFITIKDNVLEIGCGVERPLGRILTGNAAPYCRSYVGVDLNKLEPSGNQRLTYIGEFNFTERYKEIMRDDGYSVLVHLEVLEHMSVTNGKKFLKACRKVLSLGGTMLMSTPCFDGVRHAANHIHEYTVVELEDTLMKCGFRVEQRFGTFMDIKHIKKDPDRAQIFREMSKYFDNDALSCFFAPLYPDHARNNLWVCAGV